MKTRIFTLVELLMVIVVITILIAIIFPATTTVRDRSKKSACANNLRQIGMGLNMYADEHDSTYPRCTKLPSSPPASEINLPPITEPLLPYLKDRKIFLCPAEPGEHYFRSESTSYEWNSTVYNGWKSVRKAIDTTISIPKMPVMADYTPNHGAPENKNCKNYLYPFARVTAELDNDRSGM